MPEIVCDILYYLANYVHYRTDQITRSAYEKMLASQVEDTKVETKK